MSQRGTGYIADPAGHRYNAFRAVHPARKMGAAAIPDSGGPGAFSPPIWDQDGTGSCVGHAFAGALTALCASKGHALPAAVSPRGTYFLARAVDRAATSGPLPTLTDDGAAPNSAARALQVYGLDLEGDRASDRRATDPDYTAWLAAHVNDELTVLEFEDADTRRVIADWTSIDDGDGDKASLMVQALAAGFPVVFAVDASVPEFQQYDGADVLSYGGQSPDHMQRVDLYRKNAAGLWEFREGNSWGRAWGDEGYAWVDQRSIEDATFNMLIPHLL